mgnify:CR=1 FL=1
MIAKKLDNGRILVPARAESDSGVIGDGMTTIGPDHPDYPEWDSWLTKGPQTDDQP